MSADRSLVEGPISIIPNAICRVLDHDALEIIDKQVGIKGIKDLITSKYLVSQKSPDFPFKFVQPEIQDQELP